MAGYERFAKVKAIVESLLIEINIKSPEWHDEQADLLNSYKEHFVSFEHVHPDIEDLEFRANCKLLDILLNKILSEYDQFRWFPQYDYLRFMQTLVWIVEYVYEIDGREDELSGIFGELKV